MVPVPPGVSETARPDDNPPKVEAPDKPVEEPSGPATPQPRPIPAPKSGRPKFRDIVKGTMPSKVSVDKLTGPTIKSHPWDTMLAGRQPDVGTLAKCVPEDFY